MPLDFNLNPNSNSVNPVNNSTGDLPNKETEQEIKFAPPASDIFIRTPQIDLERLKTSGGELNYSISQLNGNTTKQSVPNNFQVENNNINKEVTFAESTHQTIPQNNSSFGGVQNNSIPNNFYSSPASSSHSSSSSFIPASVTSSSVPPSPSFSSFSSTPTPPPSPVSPSTPITPPTVTPSPTSFSSGVPSYVPPSPVYSSPAQPSSFTPTPIVSDTISSGTTTETNQIKKEEPVFKINNNFNTEFISEIESNNKHKKPKYILFVIIGIIIFAIIFLGYFFRAQIIQLISPQQLIEEVPVVPETPVIPVPVAPEVILPPAPQIVVSEPFAQEYLNIKPIGEFVINAIKESARELQEVGTFKIFRPQIGENYLTSEEIVLSLIPNFPEAARPFIKEKYLLYAHYGRVNPSLGLIIEVGQENIEALKPIFLTWEQRLAITRDLQNFFLVIPRRATARRFTAENILGADARYFPYPGEESALIYAFYDNYLLITSSKESLNVALTRLQAGKGGQ